MSRTVMNIAKWLPVETEDSKKLFIDCRQLKREADSLIRDLDEFLVDLNRITSIDIQKFESLMTSCQNITTKFKMMNVRSEIQPFLQSTKFRYTVEILWRVKLKLTYFLQQLVFEMLKLYEKENEKLLEFIFKISLNVNDLITLDSKFSMGRKTHISNNNCPLLLYPMRKISITKILQVIAQSRAENCCHRLIDCLLENYKRDSGYHHSGDDDSSDSSSIEIYKALTRHMTPPIEGKPAPQSRLKRTDDTHLSPNLESGEPEDEGESLEALELLISDEENQVMTLLNTAMKIVPKMLGPDGVKKSKSTGELRVSQKASTKVIDYYEQILWGEVGNYLEHVVLWWGAAPLALRPPHSSQHLREWIVQFTPTAPVPQVIVAALHSLADALGCHVTSTLWDQQFRLALVSAYKPNQPQTGKLFSELLHDLVSMSNQCEVTNEWIVGAPLEELPLVEQIPVLHRLDHSVHTTRLWAANETKKLANAWNVESFFSVTQNDVTSCLTKLKDIRLADRNDEIAKGGLSVHVQVCANMREKLVSEVRVNVDKLKEVPKECLDVLAKICRTVSLANLQMVFPEAKYWRKTLVEAPGSPSSYVATYLDRVLLPVLEATNDHTTSNMVLRIMGEAWLDHIYINKIKFTNHGALQLLVDFASIGDWLINCAIITQEVRKHMLRNEVLRRCEGVGRLLLRSPGEHIQMGKKNMKPAEETENTSETESGEIMPAEMYVPNQEQWLELRAVRKKSYFLLPTLCCGVD